MGDIVQLLEPGTVRDELVVMLHGFSRARERIAGLRQAVRDIMPNVDIYAPELPYVKGPILCYEKAETIVADLVRDINSLVKQRDYRSITLGRSQFRRGACA